MCRRKTALGTLEINKKFRSEEETELYMKRLVSYIKYISKKRKYQVSAMIVASNSIKDSTTLESVANGKRGRNKLVLKESLPQYFKGMKTDWHIHILILSNPSKTLLNDIKKYIDKNWNEIPIKKETKKIDFRGKREVYKKHCNINIGEYFIKQSSIRMFVNVNHSNNEDFKYSIKDYYKAVMKWHSDRNKLYKKLVCRKVKDKQSISLEKQNRIYEKIDNNYNKVENYFDEFDISNKKNE